MATEISSESLMSDKIRELLKKEDLSVLYTHLEGIPGQCLEGLYSQAEKLIRVERTYHGALTGLITVTHELGHHFDKDRDLPGFESRADDFMVAFCEGFGLGEEARRVRRWHEKGGT
jgi:hypothetical protein